MTVEWKNGDLLEFNGEPCVFIGDYNGIPVVRYTENADQSLAGCLDEIYAVDNLKKPETPQWREERELCEDIDSAYDLAPDHLQIPVNLYVAQLLLQMGYRKQ